MPDPHAAVIRWASIFEEPFASRASQLQADRLLADHIAADPNWMAAWAAGSLNAVMQTLPADDPWKRISAALLAPTSGVAERGAQRIFRQPESPGGIPEFIGSGTGAWLDDAPFGTFANGCDIHAATGLNPWADPSLVVLTGPSDPALPPPSADQVAHLDPTSAALLGFAGAEGAVGLQRLIQAMAHVNARHDPIEALQRWSDALRWAAWRRRIYTGNEDNFATGSMLAWITWADAYVAGQLDHNEPVSDIRDHQIPNGSHTRWVDYLHDVANADRLPPERFEDPDDTRLRLVNDDES